MFSTMFNSTGFIAGLIISWIFFNSSSSKMFSFPKFALFVSNLFGITIGMAYVTGLVVIGAEIGIALSLLTQSGFHLGALMAISLLIGFSGVAILKQKQWKGCSCFGPTTPTLSPTQTIIRNSLLLVLCGLAAISEFPLSLSWLVYLVGIFAICVFWVIPLLLMVRRRHFISKLLNREEISHANRFGQYEPL
ncbi:MAG: hypothetical protein GWN13_11615 [Phycisphaerae bacterium]|nr:hypothetical protein [Phycisphaerae bacterium]